MKALLKPITMLLFAVVMGCNMGCTKSNDNNSGGNPDNDVLVTTYTPSDVTASTAVSGCSVQVRQGLSLTKIGVCWSTSANPTAQDSQLSSEAWNEPFVKTLTGLSPNTTYHVRAFALRGLEYYYGEDKAFTTLADNGGGGGNTPVLPTVTTAQITDITQNTALCGGNVTSDGGATVLERGICWGMNHEPNISGSHIANGDGTGSYTVLMTGLTPGTVYYVRAYAVNSQGTNYGDEMHFTTLSGGGGNGGGYGPPPTGAINGVFSVSPTKQVWFSKGNLQYIGSASTPYWKFAEHQWEYLGNNGQGGSTCQTVNRDLFGWGTSGWNNGNVYYQPWDIHNIVNGSIGFGYGPTDGTDYTYDLTGTYSHSDWGVHNFINNATGQWRTLTQPEWDFVLNSRTTISGIRYAMAKISGTSNGTVNGVILFPDEWSMDTYNPINCNQSGASFNSNIVSFSQWTIFEAAGAVFLPAAGSHDGNSTHYVGSHGSYWSASCCNCGTAYFVFFYDGKLGVSQVSRCGGRSVRLVHNTQ